MTSLVRVPFADTYIHVLVFCLSTFAFLSLLCSPSLLFRFFLYPQQQKPHTTREKREGERPKTPLGKAKQGSAQTREYAGRTRGRELVERGAHATTSAGEAREPSHGGGGDDGRRGARGRRGRGGDGGGALGGGVPHRGAPRPRAEGAYFLSPPPLFLSVLVSLLSESS